jgi:uncharacterized protein (UPF0262 family)
MVAMTFIISSVKAKTSMTTKDPLKDAAWGNAYYGVDDCVVTIVKEQTKEEIEAIEAANRELVRKREEAIQALVDGKVSIDYLIANKAKIEAVLAKEVIKP